MSTETGPGDLPPMKDITTDFLNACNDLKYGEMVKLPDLSMMDAMNALVILDPRMDAGCSASSSSSSTSQTETNAGSRQGDVKDMELDPEVVVGIMDRLMQLEMTYHTGATLVQTLFTSKHFLDLHALTLDLLNTEFDSTSNSGHHPKPHTFPTPSRQLLHHVLIPYLHALRLCMYLVWTELTRGHVYDGEDFTSDPAGLWERGKEWAVPRPQGGGRGGDDSREDGEDRDEEEKGVLGYDECDFMLEDVLKRMDEGLDWLNQSELSEEDRRSLRIRIEFRKALLLHLVVVLAKSYDTLPIPYPRISLAESYSELQEEFQNQADSTLSQISHKSVDQAFDERIHARFRQMMPLAKIEILSGEAFRRRWDGFVEDIGWVEELARCGDFDVWERELIALPVGTEETLPFIRSCLASNLTPAPQTLITGYGLPNRSLLDRFLLHECGIARDTMDQIGEILAREDPAKAREFERWQSMMTGHLVAYLLNLLHNRPRCRRAMLTTLKTWEDLYASLPRYGAIRERDVVAIERAIHRQRWFMGMLGMLAALDTELWPSGEISKVPAGSLVMADGFESLVTTFWWMCTIASEYKRHGTAENTNEIGFDWKADWIEGLGYCCRVWQNLLIGSNADGGKGRGPEATSYRQAREVFEARLKHFSKTAGRSTANDPFLRPSWETAKREMQNEGNDEDGAHNLDILKQTKRCFHSPHACGRFTLMVDTLRDATQRLLHSLETHSDSKISIPVAASVEKVVRRCTLWVPHVNVAVCSG